MEGNTVYPYSLVPVLKQNEHENILDTNMFSAYIPRYAQVPTLEDPRKTQNVKRGTPRHPTYVKQVQINQIFNYIGFIKRMTNIQYREHLPELFQILKSFMTIMEEVVYTLNVTISEEVYAELKKGIENFLISFKKRPDHSIDWIEKIWKNQKIYLENIDMLVEALRVRGKIFDYSDDPLHDEIMESCKGLFININKEHPANADFRFVANCCLKAKKDNEPKTIWSGDAHIYRILKYIYKETDMHIKFPQIYLRGSYDPLAFAQLFPEDDFELAFDFD